MTFLRHQEIIDTGTLNTGETYAIPVVVSVYWNPETHREEIAYTGEAMRKIEAEIERIHPGYYHTCVENPKQHCRACTQKQFDNR